MYVFKFIESGPPGRPANSWRSHPAKIKFLTIYLYISKRTGNNKLKLHNTICEQTLICSKTSMKRCARSKKASRKKQENKFRHHDFHGNEIVRIYCTAQSIAITFRGRGWAGSFSSPEQQCFEESKTWETENDKYYSSAKCLGSIICKKLFRCCNRTSLALLLPKLQIKTPKNNFEVGKF